MKQLMPLVSPVVQVVHSGVTFGITVLCMHSSTAEGFAAISMYFLIVNLFTSSVYQWVTQLHFKSNDSLSASLLVGAVLGLISFFSVFIYLWFFSGRTYNPNLILTMLSACLVQHMYYGIRRYYLLNSKHVSSLLLDISRLLLSALWYWYVKSYQVNVDLFEYMGWVLVAHAMAVVCVGFGLRCVKSRESRNSRFLDSIRLSGGESALVATVFSTAFFSQASMLIAPLLVGKEMFAISRAYDTFYVFLVFVIQSVDPLYAKSSRAWIEVPDFISLLKKCAAPVFLIMSPVLFLAAGELSSWKELHPTKILIAQPYWPQKELFWGVVVVSIMAAFSCPLRWYISARKEGKLLFALSIASSLVSVCGMFLISEKFPGYWVPLIGKLAFEVLMLVGTGWIVFSGIKSRSERH